MRTVAIACGIAVLLFLGGMVNTMDIHTLSDSTSDTIFGEQVTTSSHTFTLSVNFSEPLVTAEGTYAEIEMEGTNAMLTYGGMPRLPYYVTTIALPWGTEITDITCTTGEITHRVLEYDILCAPLPRDMHTGQVLSFHDQTDAQTVYPREWYSYRTGSGLADDEHVLFLSLHLYPVRYEKAAHRITSVSSMEIVVRCEIPEKPLLAADTHDLLLIAPSEFTDELQPLVAHKESHGISTVLVTCDEIYDGTYFAATGRDDAERIKYFIKNALEHWGIRYVMLVGDITHVPSREVLSFAWGDHTMYSDHYYADIYDSDASFSSWDTNNNDQFGEIYENDNDAVDLYADMYVGRLACHDEDEVRTVVDKIITYENTAHDSEWFSRLILMGGDTFPGWGPFEGELVNEYVASAMPDFQHVKIQMTEHNFLPWEINRIWTEGAGFICYSGHGFEYGFGTYPHNSNWMIAYYTPYLLGLANGDRLPIIFFDACLTSKPDYHMLGNPDIPCIAWCLVKKPDGGAIATIGATETAITSVDENGIHGAAGYMDLHFFMAYEPGISVAEMLVSAQNDYLNDVAAGVADDRLYVMTIEQFILLGDPSLRVGGYP